MDLEIDERVPEMVERAEINGGRGASSRVLVWHPYSTMIGLLFSNVAPFLHFSMLSIAVSKRKIPRLKFAHQLCASVWETPAKF